MRTHMIADKENLVSIITPVYNGERFVEETIHSVLSQTYRDYEWIITDDGSTDSSYQILKQYADQDERITLLQQANAGSAAARNNGIRHAKGRYIILLDADDLWDEDYLERQIRFMKEKQAECAYASYRFIDEDGQPIYKPFICKPEVTRKEMMIKNEIGCLTGIYDCSNHGKIYLDESLKSVRDDYAYWLEIVTLVGKAYGNQNVMTSYRVSRNSVTGNKKKLVKKQYSFYRKYLNLSVIRSLYNTMRWGLAGLKKFR